MLLKPEPEVVCLITFSLIVPQLSRYLLETIWSPKRLGTAWDKKGKVGRLPPKNEIQTYRLENVFDEALDFYRFPGR